MRLMCRAACGTVVIAATLSACVAPPPKPRDASPGHLGDKPAVVPAEIPAPVSQAPFIPVPKPAPPVETYTVVVNEVPVKELLFALARDAKINVDVHPDISGNVTLNAVDQTLFQILDRISRQIDMRYEDRDGTIVITRDAPFTRTYKVDYVNVTRESTGKVSTSTIVASEESGGAAGNTSDSSLTNTIDNKFWEALQTNVEAIINPEAGAEPTAGTSGVTINRESGLMLVHANSKQHELVERYLASVMASATRQVLIEATIVEVELSDRYQAGIDWTIFQRKSGAGLTVGSDLADAFTAGASNNVTGLILQFIDTVDPTQRKVQAFINLLNEFGNTQVLSSPKVMTLNNQPAILKVVDNEVYFELDVTTTDATLTAGEKTEIESNVRTVSVGLVMNVTPQISEDGSVTLNVRPSITRVRGFVEDPGVAIALANAGISVSAAANRVPVVQVRETETVMRVGTGQLAVLGGLMQDRRFKDDESVPGFSEVPGVGELFKFREREQTKTELVVFLRPTVIRSPDVGRDLSNFQRYLPENIQDPEALRSLNKSSTTN